MRLTNSGRRMLITAFATIALATATSGALAAPGPAQPTASAPGTVASAHDAGTARHVVPVHGHGAQLRPLAELSARRLLTADLVAAAKWGTESPIDDPERERQVLKAVARQAREVGADPKATVGIFRDQIEANKLVQRALHRRWQADPSQAPTEPTDLAAVRAEINRVNGGLVRAIATSEPARTAPLCDVVLLTAGVRTRQEQALDPVHTLALARSLRSVCAPPVAAGR
ncbi:gamma subclass chorismate mutase AroQ [Streptomyces zagrosensis]|uniref:chorismate mutase n=1 Tax=Streptomyces zagrosensis TaxID=1042984 RepID=A0A7W9UXX5_9ACTN|nr:gamma subclass chorismate mutase AroQ [Streptomyces zagrosensis]MBB5935343.1 chorismate mutase [Streptomyces zagrosensis]